MSDLSLAGRKVFKVFNQDFVVDERYNVTKELGQGAYGIVWWVSHAPMEFVSAIADRTAVPQQMFRQGKGLLSRRLQTCLAKKYWRNVLYGS